MFIGFMLVLIFLVLCAIYDELTEIIETNEE